MTNLDDRRIANLRAGLAAITTYGMFTQDGRRNPNFVFIQAEHAGLIEVAKETLKKDAEMSGILVKLQVWHEVFILVQGNETFYNDRREMLTWETEDQAVEWLNANHPELQLIRETSLVIANPIKPAASEKVKKSPRKKKIGGDKMREISQDKTRQVQQLSLYDTMESQDGSKV